MVGTETHRHRQRHRDRRDPEERRTCRAEGRPWTGMELPNPPPPHPLSGTAQLHERTHPAPGMPEAGRWELPCLTPHPPPRPLWNPLRDPLPGPRGWQERRAGREPHSRSRLTCPKAVGRRPVAARQGASEASPLSAPEQLGLQGAPAPSAPEVSLRRRTQLLLSWRSRLHAEQRPARFSVWSPVAAGPRPPLAPPHPPLMSLRPLTHWVSLARIQWVGKRGAMGGVRIWNQTVLCSP